MGVAGQRGVGVAGAGGGEEGWALRALQLDLIARGRHPARNGNKSESFGATGKL